MATLKEFEDALRQRGMSNALAILDELKKRDREQRSVAPARRVVGRKMTAELARSILQFHATTGMTQQEIAFKLGVNQGRVNEVIKRGKWLNSGPTAPEILSRDKAMQRLDQRARSRRTAPAGEQARRTSPVPAPKPMQAKPVPSRVETRSVRSEPPQSRGGRPVPPEAAIVKPRIISAQLAFLDL